MVKEAKFKIVEWRIENFCCWNEEIHDKVIASPKTFYSPSFAFELFPRGLSGHDGHLLVRICYSGQHRSILGELSFIGSDGTLLCTQQVVSKDKLVDVLEPPPGPEFDEVVARIRRNEVSHGDVLTLKFWEKSTDDSVEYMRTEIDAFDESVQIFPHMLEHFKALKEAFKDHNRVKDEKEENTIVESEEEKMLLWYLFLKFSIKDIDGYMRLTLYEDQFDHSKMILTLKPDLTGEKISVFTRMTVLSNADVERSEVDAHVFRDDCEWTFSNTLTREEVSKQWFSLVLNLKIVSNNTHKHSGSHTSYEFFNTRAFSFLPANGLKMQGTSVLKEGFSKSCSDVPGTTVLKESFSNSCSDVQCTTVLKEGFSNSCSDVQGTTVLKECSSKSNSDVASQTTGDSATVLTERKVHVTSPPEKNNQPEILLCELSKELVSIYQYQDSSDFELKCGGVSFPVHKNILSALSPVFNTMLSEAVSDSLDIADLDPSTLGFFLTYLYTGEAVEDLQGERPLNLYYAAHKYQVPSLKEECVSALLSNVSVLNVCNFLSFADKHQDDLLISAAHEFILENYNEVLSSREWKGLMKREPLLAVETVTHLAELNLVGKICLTR